MRTMFSTAASCLPYVCNCVQLRGAGNTALNVKQTDYEYRGPVAAGIWWKSRKGFPDLAGEWSRPAPTRVPATPDGPSPRITLAYAHASADSHSCFHPARTPDLHVARRRSLRGVHRRFPLRAGANAEYPSLRRRRADGLSGASSRCGNRRARCDVDRGAGHGSRCTDMAPSLRHDRGLRSRESVRPHVFVARPRAHDFAAIRQARAQPGDKPPGSGRAVPGGEDLALGRRRLRGDPYFALTG